MYYSFAEISGRDQIIYATEQEVLQGGQSWDMNPLVFYRIKKPLTNTSQLKKIDLGKFYYKNNQFNRQISVVIRNKKVSPVEVDEALSHAS